MNIAFIPVRGGSKSIPLKNIKNILGKPLVYWVAKAANNALCIDKVIIATDSEEIANIAKNFRFAKLSIFERSPENAQDTSSTESVMLEYIYKSQLDKKDNFFLIQATSPLLTSEHIDAMFNKFVNSSADSIFSGVVEKQFKWFIKPDGTVQPVNYDYKSRPRRQEFEGLIAENGACYINTVGNIIQDKCRLSGNITYYEMPSYTAYEIDEKEDWIIVQELLKQFGTN